MSLMATKGMSKNDPILIRSYKKEAEMEVWKRGSNGRYALLKTYPICRWSGQLGPKTREGDRQAPEGFYTVTPAQMNPNSAYYLSFDTGYPERLRPLARPHRRRPDGARLVLVARLLRHDGREIAEIYAIAREALAGGQRGFQFQSYPFRMTAENLAQHRLDPNIALLEEPEGRLGLFRGDQGRAPRERGERPLSVQRDGRDGRGCRDAEGASGRAGDRRARLQRRRPREARLP